jgi:hypothetical protein
MPDGVKYHHETLALDGETYAGCEFRACRLVYAGGEAPSFEACKFEDCDWRLEGPAAETLSHLRVMWNAGAKPAVQAIIKDITGAR